MKRVSARELQLNFGKLKYNLPLIVTHYKRPVALVIGYREKPDGTPDVTMKNIGSHKKLYKKIIKRIKEGLNV
jgi:hypothetical protein